MRRSRTRTRNLGFVEFLLIVTCLVVGVSLIKTRGDTHNLAVILLAFAGGMVVLWRIGARRGRRPKRRIRKAIAKAIAGGNSRGHRGRGRSGRGRRS